MKTLFIECNMGAAGDMLMGALYELLPNSEQEQFLETMNSLFPDKIMIKADPSEKCGIWGTKVNVVILGHTETPETSEQEHSHERHHTLHTSYPEMLSQIDSLPVSASVKEHAKADRKSVV